MATIGQVLTTPETGWRRYDSNHYKIVYKGSGWSIPTNASYSEGVYNACANTSADGKIQFKFYGTKLRIISDRFAQYADLQIDIDGVVEQYTQKGTSAYMVLLYEKLNLTEGLHIVTISKVSAGTNSLDFTLDAIDIDDTGYLSTLIGKILSEAEEGWVRISDNDVFLRYNGTGWSKNADGDTRTETLTNASIVFKFYGTKLRVIGVSYIDNCSHKIVIDGVDYGNYSNSIGTTGNTLLFEKTNLPLKDHFVTITPVADNTVFGIDSIDIDSIGRLKPYTKGNERTSILDMKIGDMIPCRYTANSGSSGLFSELGSCSMTPIPVSANAPNGLFNWVHSGFDTMGRMKLLADRNIQYMISWDTLNTIPKTSGIFSDHLKNFETPSLIPTGVGNGIALSSDGIYMGVSHDITPFITIYKRDGDTFTKLSNPTSLPTGTGYAVAFSNDGTYMAVGHATTPFITIYKRNGDTFTKLSNPTNLPNGSVRSIAFSPNGAYMSIGYGTSPYLIVYKIEGDTFTKLTNPNSASGQANNIAFSKDNNYMAVATQNTPFIEIYKITSGDTFTKLSNPSNLPPNYGYAVDFSPDGTYMTVGHATSPFVTIYKRNSDTFTKLSDPLSLPTGTTNGVSFSFDGNYMMVGHTSIPYLTTYKRDGDIFTKIVSPSSTPTGTVNKVTNSSNGNYVAVATQTTPFVAIYKVETVNLPYTTISLRLPTGGTSATDTDNEWDKIIVSSTLDGTIIAGDNNVWNWSGASSLTSTTGTANTNRVIRGNATVNTWNGSNASSSTSTTMGFRPMLLVNIPIIRYMIQDGTSLKYINEDTLTTACNTTDSDTVKENAFWNNGMRDFSLWSNNLLSQISNTTFKIVMYKENI